MKKAPCTKECPKRTLRPNCHDSCKEYIDWHNELVAAKKYAKESTYKLTNYDFDKASSRGARKSVMRPKQ